MNRKNFRYFRFDEVFDHKRGRRLISQNQEPGEIAYISSSANNNGLDNYINPPAYMTIYKNKLTLSNSGSVGYLFYHDYEFVASDHVMVIWPKERELTKSTALFLKPIFEHIRYRYNFGREITDARLPRERLYLPIDEHGQPDWEFMDSYIESLENKVEFKALDSKFYRTHARVDTSNWKEFNLAGEKGLFEYQHGARLTVHDRTEGDVPLITAGQHNQGYAQSISNYQKDDCFQPGVTVDMFSNSFYQDFVFAADDNIYVFNKPQEINKYVGIFLATIINKQKYKYGYGRQFRKEDSEKNKFLLPVDSKGNPDWDFMEKYIESLPYAEYLVK